MPFGDATIVAIGRLGGEPELRFTPGGVAICQLSLCVQPRTKNQETQQWQDGDPTWYRVNVWREYGEHVAESLAKGDRVVVTGTVSLRKYQNREGGEGQSLEITAETVTPDLRFATARVMRPERGGASQGGGADQWNGGGNQGQRSNQGGQYNQGGRGDAPADPWGEPPANQWGGGSSRGQQGTFPGEPPFLHNTPSFIA